jgi:hypothetical protein
MELMNLINHWPYAVSLAPFLPYTFHLITLYHIYPVRKLRQATINQ